MQLTTPWLLSPDSPSPHTPHSLYILQPSCCSTTTLNLCPLLCLCTHCSLCPGHCSHSSTCCILLMLQVLAHMSPLERDLPEATCLKWFPSALLTLSHHPILSSGALRTAGKHLIFFTCWFTYLCPDLLSPLISADMVPPLLVKEQYLAHDRTAVKL